MASRSTSVTLVDATEEHVAQITAIYNYYVRTSISTLQEEESTVSGIASKMAGIKSRGLPYMVAKDTNGTICGYIYADDWNERSGYRFSAESSIYLHPNHCGKGLGKQLLQANVETLRGCGRRQVLAKMTILPTQRAEDVPSCRLHMSLGFESVGRLRNVGLKFGKWADVIILQLQLVEGTG